MCDDITLVEAADALGLEVEDACALFGRRCPISLRDVLSIRIATELIMLGTEAAATLARAAAAEARTEGSARLFAVGWDSDRKPFCGWLGATVPRDMTRAVLLVPADRWLRQLIDHITNHRAGAAHSSKEPRHHVSTSSP